MYILYIYICVYIYIYIVLGITKWAYLNLGFIVVGVSLQNYI